MTLTVTGGGLRAVVDAARGGRILSLATSDGYEWLAPDSSGGVRGTPFVRAGMGGWDEVIPTVEPSTLADGTVLPDHGDAWNTPWEVLFSAPSALVMRVTLTSVPVVVRRTITAIPDGLRLSYSASTPEAATRSLLWCAHPQFRADRQTTVTLWSSDVRVTPSLVEEYPRAGAIRGFPADPVLASLPAGGSLKVFVSTASTVDSATLSTGTGRRLGLRWDPRQLPYLGIFWDNGEFAPAPIVAIEPATALGDSASEAESTGHIRTLSADAPLNWHLDVTAA